MTSILWSPDNAASPLSGAEKYVGLVAENYDAKREDSPKWIAEQAIIESMLDGIPAGDWVLDIPVGTGRFLKAYDERQFQVWAVDRSAKMLGLANDKAVEQNLNLRAIRYVVGDIRDLSPMQNKSVDVSVACRITRWFSPEECRQAWAELARVTRKRIIFTTRIRHERVPEVARPLDLFAVPGWRIVRDEAGYEEDYRIVAMEPA